MSITLATIESAVQNELRNSVNSPHTTGRRVEAYNRVIDTLQAKANWKVTKRIATFDFLNTEVQNNLEKLDKNNTLYMIGDVQNKIYRQTGICVADGIKAALDIYNSLKEKGNM